MEKISIVNLHESKRKEIKLEKKSMKKKIKIKSANPGNEIKKKSRLQIQ
jgi:hypothetical protein